MTETNARQAVVAALNRGKLHALSIENGVGAGTPDIYCAAGWVEMKWRAEAPKREATPCKPKEPLKPGQRIFLEDEIEAGGRAYVLFQIEREQEWILLDGLVAARILGIATRAALKEAAIAVWYSRQEMEQEVAACLSARRR